MASPASAVAFVPDVHIICDATSSMSSYLESLKTSVVQIASLLRIVSPDARLGMRAYRDFCDSVVTESVPMRAVSNSADYQALLKFVRSVKPNGGGDLPEACKRGLFESLEAQDIGQGTIVLLYADAPAHFDDNGALVKDSNGMKEKAWFAAKQKVEMWDWVRLARAYADAGAHVFTFISGSTNAEHLKMSRLQQQFATYAALSTITGGQCFGLSVAAPSVITAATMSTLLNLFGCESGDLAKNLPSGAGALSFDDNVQESLHKASTELNMPAAGIKPVASAPVSPLGRIDLKLLPRRFKTDAAFREVVFEVIGFLLTEPQHAMALTTNAVFGTLWRAVCCCRDDPRRDQLVDVMGKLSTSPSLSLSDRQTLSAWLAESYDQSAEILYSLSEAIKKGVASYPALVLSEAGTKEFAFSDAKELLEIARICDAGTMSRITSLLTHLTVVREAPPQTKQDVVEESKSSDQADEDSEIDPSIGTRLPLGLSDRDLFQLLPHLMCPGTRFSLRPAVIIAAIAYLADIKVVKPQAERFLRESKGKWFADDQAENFSVGFIRLVNRLPAELALTDKEAELFGKLKTVSGFAANVQSTYEVEIGYKPSHQEARIADHRPQCAVCQCHCSFTLMVRDPKANDQVVCSTCYWKARPSEDDTVVSAEGQRQLAEDAAETKTSHLAECRTCHSLYAVVRTGDLKVEPKCHACRYDKGVCARVSCTECYNSFLDPAQLFTKVAAISGQATVSGEVVENRQLPYLPEGDSASSAAASTIPSRITAEQLVEMESSRAVSFKCGACMQAGRAVLKTCTATLQDLVDSSHLSDDAFEAELGVRWKTADVNKRRNVLDGQTRKPLMLDELLEIMAPSLVADRPNKTVWKLNGKRIVQAERMVADMNARIRSGEGQIDTCYLCCRDLPCDAMKPACGSCPSRSCTTCLTAWYGAAQPGSLVLPAHLACPFCKVAPKPSILAKYNHEACTIRRAVSGPKVKLSLDHYYAWCKSCYRIKELTERRCTDGAVPECTKFECEECRTESAVRAAKAKDPELSEAELAALMGKPCPGCGIQISKVSGCNHLQCPVASCGVHFCAECGEVQTEDTIYDHMLAEHGSYYDFEY